MIRRGGALIDREDSRDYAVGRALVGSPSDSLPTAVDYRPAWGPVRDQGQSNSCTGQSLAKSAETWCRLRGVAVKEPFSPLFPYWIGRWNDRNGNEPVHDGGARPRVVATGAQQYGLCAESAWPFDEARINAAPNLSTFRSGITHRVQQFVRVLTTGETRLHECRRALAEGNPLTLTVVLDEGFDSYDGTGVIGLPRGSMRGYHRVALVGYRPGAFILANSWSGAWGASGFAWVSDARIADASTVDLEATSVVEL